MSFWKNPEIPDTNQDGRHSDIMTQLLRHMTSSPYYKEFKENILGRTIYPLSFVVKALYFWRYGGERGIRSLSQKTKTSPV